MKTILCAIAILASAITATADTADAPPHPRTAGVIYVDDNGDINGDGSSWQAALRHLQDALAAAANPVNGISEIRIAQGIYRPDERRQNPKGTGNRLDTFQMRTGLRIFGGYRGNGTPNPDKRDPTLYITILSGDLNGDDGANFTNRTDNSAHVVTAIDVDRTAVLDGVQILGGAAGSAASPPNPSVNGGGMYLRNAGAIVANVLFRDNQCGVQSNGHCVFVESGRPMFENCTFADFVPSNYNGGMFGSTGDPVLVDCTIERTHHGLYARGGSITAIGCIFRLNADRTLVTVDTDVTLRDCLFLSNGSYTTGLPNYIYNGSTEIIHCDYIGNSSDGAIVDITNSDGVVAGCRFIDNESNQQATLRLNGQTIVRNCLFDGNSTHNTNCGAICLSSGSLQCTNTLVANTYCYQPGSAIYIRNDTTATLTNCTIAGNKGSYPTRGLRVAAGPTVRLDNCILWDNGENNFEDSQFYLEPGANFTMNYCCIRGWSGNQHGGTGNFPFDPLFVVPFVDFHLNVSLNVDSAAQEAQPPCATDLDGNARVYDDPDAPGGGLHVIDRGAYERGSIPVDDCDGDGLDDSCAIANAFVDDCNNNGVPDYCDLRQFPDIDCNRNLIPDDCEILQDCDNNGVPDECEAIAGRAFDCNGNGVPDSCDISSGDSADCNNNTTPDECEHDCNNNGVADDCDLLSGALQDVNNNGIPDVCENVYNQNTGLHYSTINHAIVQANNGNTILIQPGHYMERINFLGKELAVRSTMGPDLTILDGNGLGPTVTFDNYESRSSSLEGFTITGGAGVVVLNRLQGGGLFIVHSSPTFRNCTFHLNDLTQFGNGRLTYGGAAHIDQDSDPEFIHCTFLSNTADYGGAVYIKGNSDPLFTLCIFELNRAIRDAGAVNVDVGYATFVRCDFIDNSSDSLATSTLAGGGALRVSNAGGSTLDRCVFTGNVAHQGGAIVQAGAEILAHRCLFQNNFARNEGGAISSRETRTFTRYLNCIFFENHAGVRGGSAYLGYDTNSTFMQCTFAGNSAPDTGGIVHADGISSVIASILWNNPGGSLKTIADDPLVVDYCNVDQPVAGFGNFNRDPLFVDMPSGDLRLQNHSPCIDAGAVETSWLPYGGDYDGNPRKFGCRTDVGAFESTLTGLDCNSNGLSDGCDALNAAIVDCNNNGIIDDCEITQGAAIDCNNNGIPDECDIADSYTFSSNYVGPLIDNRTYNFVVHSPPPAASNLIVSGYSTSRVLIKFNGVAVSAVNAGNCANATIGGPILSAAVFNAAIANGPLTVTITGDSHPTCDESFGRVLFSYRLSNDATRDCNNNGVLDECEIDCNSNGRPDDCDIADKTSDDCNNNFLPDECDIADGDSMDFNSNGVPDECEPDCNMNNVPDFIEIFYELVPDCNDNMIPDECDVATAYEHQSPPLGPVSGGVTVSHLIVSPPKAVSDVSLTIAARSDLGSSSEYIEVRVNGLFIGNAFVLGAHDCPAEPDTYLSLLPVNFFNDVADGGDVEIRLTPTSAVGFCSNAHLSVNVSYESINPSDLEGNGIPDECETPGDVNGDDVVDVNDLFLMLENWGPCAPPCPPFCPGDIFGPDGTVDCVVDVFDLFRLLANWS